MSDTRANHTAKRQVKWGQNEEETYSFFRICHFAGGLEKLKFLSWRAAANTYRY